MDGLNDSFGKEHRQISFQGPNQEAVLSDSEFDSNESSDFDDELDDEAKKAKDL